MRDQISGGLHLLNKRPGLYVFFLAAIMVLGTSLNSNRGLYWDAADYFNLGRSFYQNGFSFLHYADPLRGYFLPFCMFGVQALAYLLHVNEIVFFRLIFGLLVAGFLSSLVPAYVEALSSRRIGFLPRLLFTGVVIYFWHGYFLYPLSDFPALMLLVVSLYLLWLAMEAPPSFAKSLPRLVLAGVALSAAWSTRPAYEITLVPVTLYWAYRLSSLRPGFGRSVVWLALFTSGVGLGLLPQMCINLAHTNTLNPFPRSDCGEGRNLFAMQLRLGVEVQRYETSVGTDWPTPQVVFWDPQGIKLRGKPPLPGDLSFKTYGMTVLRHPGTFLSIYFRHFFNGMDITYNTPYLESVLPRRSLFRLLNYSAQFVFLVLTFLHWRTVVRQFGVLTHLATLLAPVVLAIPVAVETRFFLPLHLMMYAVLCFLWAPSFRVMQIRPWLYVLIPLYGLYLLTCLALSYLAFSNL